MVRAAFRLVLVLGVGFWAGALRAADPAATMAAAVPESMSPASSRIIKTFDFEETALGNFDPIPMFWNKVIGRGYPLYATGKFDRTVYRSRETSFRLDLDGGSVAYQLAPGKLRAGAGADYYITGFVKTGALPHARAQLTAWLADAKGIMIAGSEASSEAWASADGTDDWHLLQLYLPGTAADARSVVLQVGLLQPQQLGAGQLGQFEIFQQDIHGAAWFDDITVFQLPRVALTASAPAQVFTPDHPVQLDVALSDLGRDQLHTRVSVTNSAGVVVATQDNPVTAHPGALWNQAITFTPRQLAQGAYTAQLDVLEQQSLLARRQMNFLVCDAVPPGQRPAPEFGIAAVDWPVASWPQLAKLSHDAGIGLLQLPAWRKDVTDDAVLRRDPALERLLAQLEQAGIQPLLNFSEAPQALAAKLPNRTDSIVDVLDADPALWRPYVSFLLARYGNRVVRWEIGRERDAFYSNDARHVRVYANARTEMAALLNHPKLILPWNVLYDFDPKNFPDAALELRIPASVKAAEIPHYLQSFTGRGTEVLALVEPQAAACPRVERLADFAQRVVLARFSKPVAVLIDMPVAQRNTLAGPAFEPSELFLVYRTLVGHLGGKMPRAQVTPAPGVHGYLFDNDGDGTLALWSDDPATGNVRMALGVNPQQVDLLGVVTPVVPVDGVSQLKVGGTPILIEHVDGHLVEICGSFALGTTNVPAGSGIVRTPVRLENPYPVPLSARLRLVPPEGWTIDPANIEVRLGPGAALNVPLTVRYPFSEFVGPKTLRGQLQVDGAPRPLALSTQVTVGSNVVAIDALKQTMPNGDLVLQEMVTNVSNVPLDAQAYAMIPGAARQERFVLNLPPNQTVIKRFTFRQAGNLAGKTGVLGLRQNDGRVLLTRSVPLD